MPLSRWIFSAGPSGFESIQGEAVSRAPSRMDMGGKPDGVGEHRPFDHVKASRPTAPH